MSIEKCMLKIIDYNFRKVFGWLVRSPESFLIQGFFDFTFYGKKSPSQ